MKITIDHSIKAITPDFHIAVMVAEVAVFEDEKIDSLIHQFEAELSSKYAIEDVVTMDIIKDGRDAYKQYGKDPSRYRLAVESLYRRIVKGNSLYRINNVVDLGNIVSLYSRKSVAVLDYNKIVGDVVVRLGTEEDVFEGIGRGNINISKIPLYEDQVGPFGSTTSDTNRTMITTSTTKILLFIISFNGLDSLANEMAYAEEIYKQYAQAKITDSYII